MEGERIECKKSSVGYMSRARLLHTHLILLFLGWTSRTFYISTDLNLYFSWVDFSDLLLRTH